MGSSMRAKYSRCVLAVPKLCQSFSRSCDALCPDTLIGFYDTVTATWHGRMCTLGYEFAHLKCMVVRKCRLANDSVDLRAAFYCRCMFCYVHHLHLINRITRSWETQFHMQLVIMHVDFEKRPQKSCPMQMGNLFCYRCVAFLLRKVSMLCYVPLSPVISCQCLPCMGVKAKFPIHCMWTATSTCKV